MSIHDRRYDERRPPRPPLWRRIVGENDNPLTWSFKIARIARITVRIHLFFVLWVVVQLLSSARADTLGIGFQAAMLAALFFMVLLHEFGHCFACRWVGGTADEILMWPLGGLALCAPPPGWKPAFITTIGGPAVNVALIPVLGVVMIAAGAPGHALIGNPFDPGAWLVSTGFTDLASGFLFFVYYTNIVLLLFNVLLPMYPLDGGRILQELLWWRLGRERSLHIAATAGLVIAVALGLYAVTSGAGMLFGVALFGGFYCWQERRSLQFLAETGPEFPTAYEPVPARRSSDDAAYRRVLKEQKQRQAEQAEVDRILEKISSQGMQSLTNAERKTLERDTQRRRTGV